MNEQPFNQESSAHHGPFYVTNILEVTHPEVEESNGQTGGGGVSSTTPTVSNQDVQRASPCVEIFGRNIPFALERVIVGLTSH